MNIQNIRNILEDKLFLQLDLQGKRIYLKSVNKPILKLLKQKYNNFKVSEFIYLLKNKNNLENLHIFCPVCGKKNKFIDTIKGYHFHCSVRCSTLDNNVQEKLRKTNLLKYGTTYYSKTDKHKKFLVNMWKNMNINKIIQKIKQTKKQKYNDPNYHNIEKMKQTNIQRYGVPYNWSSKDPKLNGQFTREKLYGVGSCFASKDPKLNGKSTIKERYGNEYYSKTNIFKNLWKDENFKNKREQKRIKTLQEKYKGRTPIIDPIIQNKRLNSLKKNGTFNSSKIENKIYLKLKEKFLDIVHIYKDKNRYPYNCDFYIPSKDLFIELNFHWTHGKEPFDNNKQKHLEKLNLWKKKSEKSKFYKTAIDVWTKRDVKKLETFKQNNLNYKIFYTLNEFLNWFRII